MSWMFAIPFLGLATGLRTMTPIAVLCWFAFLGYLPVEGTRAFWTARVVAVVVFSIFALGEYVGDKLSQTPNRTAPFPLLARLGFGSFVGCIVSTAMRGSLVEGTLLGAAGAALGTFAGFWVRRELVKKIRCPDWWVALPEDLLAVLCAGFAMHLAAR